MNILFSGLQKSGKTSVGKALSLLLDCPFIDTDKILESHYGEGNSCRDIYLQKGETAFRDLEQRAISSLSGVKNSVIALGGGSLENSVNQNVVRSLGLLVYLKTPIDIIWERILEDGVPAYLPSENPKNSFYTIAKKRIILFEELADITVDTGLLSKEEVAWEVIHSGKFSKSLLGASLMEKLSVL